MMPINPRGAPVTFLTCAGAIGLTAMFHAGIGVEWLVVTPAAFSTEPFRLVTSTLVHGSILHLLFNLYWTWNFGNVVEGRLGTLATTALYLGLAAGSGAAQFAIGDGGIGLSGVGYGLFGLLWVAERREPHFGGVMDRGTVRLFVGWFFLCIFLTRMDIMPIANTAHGVGAVLGGLAGWLLVAPERARRMRTTALATALCLCFAAAVVARPHLLSGEARQRQVLDGALVELEDGDFEGARARIEEVHREAGDLGDSEFLTRYLAYCYFNLGNGAFERERFEEAIELYQQVLALTPEDATTWYNIGLTRGRLGQLDLARKALLRATTLAPDDTRFQNALDSLRD